MSLTDAELVRAFEDCTLPPADLGHAEHVRLGFLFLRDAPLVEAAARFLSDLRRYTAAHGASGKVHETVTWAYLVLIQQRLEQGGRDLSWDVFARANEDLLARRPPILSRWYTDETLRSDLARRVFVLPDRPVSG